MKRKNVFFLLGALTTLAGLVFENLNEQYNLNEMKVELKEEILEDIKGENNDD